jgi:hypothetical protein
MASKGLYSQAGTCFSAAACTTTVTPANARCRRRGITHVADKVAQAGVIEAAGAHVMLLQFVAAEDDQPLGVILAQHDLDEFFPNEPVPPVTSTSCSDQFIEPALSISLNPVLILNQVRVKMPRARIPLEAMIAT